MYTANSERTRIRFGQKLFSIFKPSDNLVLKDKFDHLFGKELLWSTSQDTQNSVSLTVATVERHVENKDIRLH